VLGERHPQTLQAMSNLAATLQNRGKFDEAAPIFAELHERARDAEIPAEKRGVYAARYGICLVKLEQYAQAEAPLREGVAGLRDAGPSGYKSLRDALSALARACDELHRADDAARWRAELVKWEASTRPATTSAAG
jgi:hypothetical protein